MVGRTQGCLCHRAVLGMLYSWALAHSLPLVHGLRHHLQTPGERVELSGAVFKWLQQNSLLQTRVTCAGVWLQTAALTYFPYSVNFSGNWFQSSGTCLWEGLQFPELSSKISQMLPKPYLSLTIPLRMCCLEAGSPPSPGTYPLICIPGAVQSPVPLHGNT